MLEFSNSFLGFFPKCFVLASFSKFLGFGLLLHSPNFFELGLETFPCLFVLATFTDKFGVFGLEGLNLDRKVRCFSHRLGRGWLHRSYFRLLNFGHGIVLLGQD